MTEKKKKRAETVECYYCHCKFKCKKVVIQRQKAKHITCYACDKKLSTFSGMAMHLLHVQKESLTKIVMGSPRLMYCITGMREIFTRIQETLKKGSIEVVDEELGEVEGRLSYMPLDPLGLSKKEEIVNEKYSALLPDLLETISDRLPLQDYIVFRSVCNNWRLAPSNREEIVKFSKNESWFMFYDWKDGDKCFLYHPDPDQKCCTFPVPDLRGATCIVSRFGWLLARRGCHYFLCNPFFLERIDMPDLLHTAITEEVGTFSAPPTSIGCKVFIVRRIDTFTLEINSIRLKDMNLNTRVIDTSGINFSSILYCFELERWRLVIYDTLFNRLVYNRRRNDFCVTQSAKKTTNSSGSFEKLYSLYGKDWLSRFGAEASSISTCVHQIDNKIKLARNCTPQAENNSREKLKAVWIDPLFSFE